VSVSFNFARDRLIVPPVEMRHSFPAWPAMALDTGARLTVIVPELARALGLEPDKARATMNVVGATGSASAAVLSMASLSLLGLEVKNLSLAQDAPDRIQ